MAKSGFEDFEVKTYKDGKLRPKTPEEKTAFEAMEKAAEKTKAEFTALRSKILTSQRS